MIARSAGFIALGFAIAGCGNGNDPMNLFHATSATVPTFVLPIDPSSAITQVKPFDTSSSVNRDGFDITSGGAPKVAAPIDGEVVAVYTDSNNGLTVTIFYNSYVSVRLAFLLSTTVREGDYVSQGQDIGLPANSLTRMSVLINGVATCPYSYLNTAGRQTVNSDLFGSTTACSQ